MPVTEFVDSIKEMQCHVDKLVKFYMKHTGQARSQSADRTDQTDQQDKQAKDEVLSPLACAKLELAIVFAIYTCYWLYLVTNGEDPSKNAISKDLERIRLFMKRAKEINESIGETGPTTKKVKKEPQEMEEWP